MLRKANQKRSLDDLVIQKGAFDWRSIFGNTEPSILTKALGEFEDTEDAQAAELAAHEEDAALGADEADFEEEGGDRSDSPYKPLGGDQIQTGQNDGVLSMEEDEGGAVGDYMLAFIQQDSTYFEAWQV